MSVTCHNCGRVNKAGARYCASCRTPLSATAARLQVGQLLNSDRYRVVQALGKGGMGAVWLVAQTEAFNRLAVVKEVIDYFDPTDADARQKAMQRFEAEARTLGDLKHPGIPDLYAYFSEGGHNYLVMEYIEGPDLRKGLTREDGDTGQLVTGGPLPADQVLGHTIEICKVLEYLALRQPPVVHNDIKPGNILIDKNSGRAVLVDFGTAKTRYLHIAGQPDGGNASVYGTVGYAAPELYQGRSEPRSDVYSLAATAYHLLTDDDPRDHPFQYPRIDTLPRSLAEILREALANDIEDRLSATQFREQLEGFLAGQAAPLRALTFPGGETANNRRELVTLAVKHWSYAAGILADGTLARWLNRTLHAPDAVQAAQSAMQQWPNNSDAALDTFLRRLNPAAVPAGIMEVRTASLRLRDVGVGVTLSRQIMVANRGRGYLRGVVDSSRLWVQVGNGQFGCPPGQAVALPIKIDTTGLVAGETYLAAVTLSPSQGAPEVVPVRISVTGPVIQVEPIEVDFGTVSRKDQTMPRRTVAVRNASQAVARCRVQGAPGWLQVRPEAFELQPGKQLNVEFVGRPDRVRGRRHEFDLTIALDGGQDQSVQVFLRVKGGGLFG